MSLSRGDRHCASEIHPIAWGYEAGGRILRAGNQFLTALMFAAGAGHTPVVIKLFEHDADPELRNLDRKQASDLASAKNQGDIIGLLETQSSRFPW